MLDYPIKPAPPLRIKHTRHSQDSPPRVEANRLTPFLVVASKMETERTSPRSTDEHITRTKEMSNATIRQRNLRYLRGIIPKDLNLISRSNIEHAKGQRQGRDIVPEAKLVALDSFAVPNTTSSKWRDEYVPPPIINQSTILLVGLFLFLLATLWPPLIILVAYVASKLVPYSFRENDDATQRRILFAEFSKQEDLPEAFKTVPNHIKLEESYWVNQR